MMSIKKVSYGQKGNLLGRTSRFLGVKNEKVFKGLLVGMLI